MNWLTKQFELSRGGSQANVRPMEGIRGFAVLLVFLVHYVTLVQPWLEHPSMLARFSEQLHRIGNVGVDLFFVLSGYLIYGSLIKRPQTFIPYFLRRLQRIYPAFLIVFILYLGLSYLSFGNQKIPSGFAAGGMYLLENILLLPGLFPIEPLITVAWSLSYEMFYYLVIPALIAALGLRRWSALQRIVLFLAIAIGFVLFCSVREGPVRLVMFIAGILLVEMRRIQASPPNKMTSHRLIAWSALGLGLCAPLLPVSGVQGTSLKAAIVFVAFFVMCKAVFDHPHRGLSQTFSWTPLRWLGNMSYSYYLIHGLCLNACFSVLAHVQTPHASPLLFWLLLPVFFAVTLLPASALFILIERPYSIETARAKNKNPVPLNAAIYSESACASANERI